jgi:hypothetical protein
MKKILLIIMSFSLLLVGQQTKDEYTDHNEMVRTGTILAIENNRINFDEMWLEIAPLKAKDQPIIIITGLSGETLSMGDLEAPCKVELTYREINNTFTPLRITMLEQYRYDDKGFICTDQE